MLDLGCWSEDARREAVRHTTGDVKRDCRDLVMISSLFFGWRHRIDGWRVDRLRFRGRNCGRWRPFDRFDADNFGIWRVFGALDGDGLGLVLILGDAVGAAAAELLGGAQDGAVQAGFVALEAGQDAFRAAVGVALGDEGETAHWVEGAIPAIVIFDQAFVFVLVEGGFHALNPQPAPGGHGDLGDEDFLGGGGGLVFGVEPVEQGVELGGIFAGQDEGFGVQAVFEAVETNGGAAFGRGRARAVLRVETISFDLSVSRHNTPLVLRFVGVWNTFRFYSNAGWRRVDRIQSP